MATIAFAQDRPVRGDYVGGIRRAASAQPSTITAKETLKITWSDSGSPGVSATCGTAGCLATPATIYSYNLLCPVLAGQTCTYEVEISGDVINVREQPNH